MGASLPGAGAAVTATAAAAGGGAGVVREDNRLLDGAPMRPVSCGRCGANVLARKSSWQQTSVQWDADALALCEERAPGSGGFESCAALAATIRRAAVEGGLEVLDKS